jgi:hypothetical protein
MLMEKDLEGGWDAQRVEKIRSNSNFGSQLATDTIGGCNHFLCMLVDLQGLELILASGRSRDNSLQVEIQSLNI